MKRIAVASNGNQMAEHFSAAEGYRIYEFEGTTVHVVDYLENEDALKGNLPEQLKALEVEEVLAGGIGAHQTEKLTASGITVFSGLAGDISEIILQHHRGQIVESNENSGCGGSCGCGSKSDLSSSCGCGSSCGCHE